MNSQGARPKALEDMKLNVKLKLAGLWTSFMFLYIYVDYFSLYKSGYLEGVLAGKVWKLEITQEFLLAGLIGVTIPALMIYLALALPAEVNRWTNIILAAVVYVPFSLFNLVGETVNYWYMMFGAAVEVVLLLLIVWYAWTWPKQEAESNPMFFELPTGKAAKALEQRSKTQ